MVLDALVSAETECTTVNRYVPAALNRPKVFLGHIPKGLPGTKRTVDHMQHLILQGAKDFYVRQKAIDILIAKRIKPKDYLGEIRSLFEWVQHHVRYTKDPYRVEVLHTPRRMLELRAGDCDDMTIVLAAMLESIGHPTRLVLVGPDPSRPTLFSHVYLEAFHQGHWIPLDPTMPHPMGWAPSRLVKRIFSLNRSPRMLSQDNLEGLAAPATASGWLNEMVLAVANQGIQAKDPRVRTLWETLRRRRLLSRSAWMRGVLQHMWQKGLDPRPRPRTASRMLRLLHHWGLMSTRPPVAAGGPVMSPFPRSGPQPLRPIPVRSVRPVKVTPVATVKQVAARNVPARSINGLETGT